MGDLFDSPAAGTIRSFQLVTRQTGNGVAEITRRPRDDCNQLRPIGLGDWCVPAELADGITKIRLVSGGCHVKEAKELGDALRQMDRHS